MKPEFDWKDAEWLISEWGDTGPAHGPNSYP